MSRGLNWCSHREPVVPISIAHGRACLRRRDLPSPSCMGPEQGDDMTVSMGRRNFMEFPGGCDRNEVRAIQCHARRLPNNALRSIRPASAFRSIPTAVRTQGPRCPRQFDTECGLATRLLVSLMPGKSRCRRSAGPRNPATIGSLGQNPIWRDRAAVAVKRPRPPGPQSMAAYFTQSTPGVDRMADVEWLWIAGACAPRPQGSPGRAETPHRDEQAAALRDSTKMLDMAQCAGCGSNRLRARILRDRGSRDPRPRSKAFLSTIGERRDLNQQ